jgi:hypothetical protein
LTPYGEAFGTFRFSRGNLDYNPCSAFSETGYQGIPCLTEKRQRRVPAGVHRDSRKIVANVPVPTPPLRGWIKRPAGRSNGFAHSWRRRQIIAHCGLRAAFALKTKTARR